MWLVVIIALLMFSPVLLKWFSEAEGKLSTNYRKAARDRDRASPIDDGPESCPWTDPRIPDFSHLDNPRLRQAVYEYAKQFPDSRPPGSEPHHHYYWFCYNTACKPCLSRRRAYGTYTWEEVVQAILDPKPFCTGYSSMCSGNFIQEYDWGPYHKKMGYKP